MNDETTTTSSKVASKDKEEELPTVPAETSIEDSTKADKEKKVVVVKPGEPGVKISEAQDQSEEAKREDDKDKQ
jgi:hypothetical protein